MILTPEKARGKYCMISPLLASKNLTIDERISSVHATAILHEPSKCKADECMHWSWLDDDNPKEGSCGLCPQL